MTTENKLENPLKQEVVLHEEESTDQKNGEEQLHLRNFIIQYVGMKLNPEDGRVTMEMFIQVLAEEFPEIVMAIAEENFMRGYEQALQDTETVANIPEVLVDETGSKIVD